MLAPGLGKVLIVGAILVVTCALLISLSLWDLTATGNAARQHRPLLQPVCTTGKPSFGVVRLVGRKRTAIWAAARHNTFSKIWRPWSQDEWMEAMRASLFLQGLTPTTSCLQTR
eukprot:scpid110226/ scgid10497/ 